MLLERKAARKAQARGELMLAARYNDRRGQSITDKAGIGPLGAQEVVRGYFIARGQLHTD